MAKKKPGSKATRRPRAGPAAADAAATRPALEHIRERIDQVDSALHALINERAQLAQQVGLSKHAAGHTVDFYRPPSLAASLFRCARAFFRIQAARAAAVFGGNDGAGDRQTRASPIRS